MLTSEELKQIGQEVAQVIEDNINPQLEEIRSNIEDNINPQLEEIRSNMEEIRNTMVTKEYLDAQLQEIHNTMVTKEYLDKKLAQDMRLRSLVDLLEAKQVITPDEAKRLFIMDPFPQTM